MIVAGDVSHLPYEFPQNRRALTTCNVVVQDMMTYHMQIDDMLAKVACEPALQPGRMTRTTRVKRVTF